MTTTLTSTRWAAVGRSDAPDARAAGTEAARGALAGGLDAKLLVAFSSDAYDLDALLAGIHDAGGDVPLVGCSTAGEIATDGAGDQTVVVFAIGGDGFDVATGAAVASDGDLRGAAAAATSCADDVVGGPHRVVLLLSDGLSGDQQEVVRGAYARVGAGVPLVGGCAGDDMKMRETYQFHGRQVLRDGVVAATIASAAPIGIGVRHGWRKVGDPMLVTGSAGTRVDTLDDRPALDCYLEHLGVTGAARIDAEAFTRFALTHPLGLDRNGGEVVRFVAGADLTSRSLNCIAEVPEGGLAWLMEGDDESVLTATDQACAEALDALDGHRPLGVLAFDCIARRGVLGPDGIGVEMDRIAAHADGAPVAGFYTYGEFARTRGVSGFHNQTLVVLALA
jgi:hypothetical protein